MGLFGPKWMLDEDLLASLELALKDARRALQKLQKDYLRRARSDSSFRGHVGDSIVETRNKGREKTILKLKKDLLIKIGIIDTTIKEIKDKKYRD